jgi:hypothetical protein
MRLLREEFRRIVKCCLARGEPHATGDELAALSYGCPPHHTKMSCEEEHEFGFANCRQSLYME